MEIFVSELPKKGACFNGCPYAVTDTWVYYCPFQQDENGDHLIVEEGCIKTCPLKPLSDRLAEERKKVVQEIRDLAGDYFEMPYCDACGNTDFNDVVLTGKDLTEILDDVERGE